MQTGSIAGKEAKPNTGEVDIGCPQGCCAPETELAYGIYESHGVCDSSLAAKARRLPRFDHASYPRGREVATISFWDHKGNVEAYNSSCYPEVLKILAKLLDGTPYVKTFDVVSSTFQRVALAPPPEAENLVQEHRG